VHPRSNMHFRITNWFVLVKDLVSTCDNSIASCTQECTNRSLYPATDGRVATEEEIYQARPHSPSPTPSATCPSWSVAVWDSPTSRRRVIPFSLLPPLASSYPFPPRRLLPTPLPPLRSTCPGGAAEATRADPEVAPVPIGFLSSRPPLSPSAME
jgi:hypothetical protein